jgi:hypothetical protein
MPVLLAQAQLRIRPISSSRHSDKPMEKNVTPTKTVVAIAQSQHCVCVPVDQASLGMTLVTTS